MTTQVEELPWFMKIQDSDCSMIVTHLEKKKNPDYKRNLYLMKNNLSSGEQTEVILEDDEALKYFRCSSIPWIVLGDMEYFLKIK